jgi:ankyrin repeat protein
MSRWWENSTSSGCRVSFRQYWNSTKALWHTGANVNAAAAQSRGFTALQGYAIRGHIGMTMKLLECGVNVNAPGSSSDGRTALEGAAEHGRLDAVQLLLNAGADSTKPEEKRYLSAIRYAENNKHSSIVSILKS